MNSAEISIILPTYNESKNIRGILDHIKKSFPSNLKLETIIVDDNSPDNTAKIAEDYFQSIKEKSSHTINVIKRIEFNIEKNNGYKINAKAFGENLDLKKHNFKVEIKAPTFYEMVIKNEEQVYMKFLLDL